MKLQEICGVLRDDRQALRRGEGEVDLVVLAVQANVRVRRSDNPMPRPPEEVRQQIGIRAVVKLPAEGHGQPLPPRA
jgi:hypothetical protein